jgi:UDP-N-acetylmuramoylalanine--D-glutamate ligase
VVLLSPACTSYDMYKDFEERGREFVRLVEAL